MRRSTSSESNSTPSEPGDVIIDREAVAQIARPGRPPLSSPLRISFVRTGALLLIAAAMVGGSQVSHAESTAAMHDGELTRWVYSAALEVGIFGHTGKGNIDSTDVGTPRVNPNFGIGDIRGDSLIPSEASREQILSALVGGDFEVMTPRLADVPTHPRLFFDVNISAAMTNEVGLARSGEPSVLQFPRNFDPGSILGENVVAGRGTKINVQHQGPQLHIGQGVAFTFDFGAERIRIKPSIVYSRIIADVSGVANRAVRLRNFTPFVPRDFDSEFRRVELSDKFREVYHGVGPAVEVEYETANRIGPFALSLFIKGHASHLLGDLETELRATNQDPTVTGDESVRFKYSQDRWVFRASTGIRFRLVPRRRR
ncbi:hypothetical protein N8077_05325 [Myxococcota bacterium]|nr:hypothetical protein [Myxococcota bacterium]